MSVRNVKGTAEAEQCCGALICDANHDAACSGLILRRGVNGSKGSPAPKPFNPFIVAYTENPRTVNVKRYL